MSLLLHGGKILQENTLIDADILIEERRIKTIGSVGKDVDEEIDCTGKVILPGLIDAHVHFREPGAPQKEDFSSGSKAAAAGGVTTVLDMPNNNPPVISQQELDEKKQLAAKSLVNYGLYIGATKENIEQLNATDAIAVKVYLGSSTGNLLLDNVADFARLMEQTEKLVVTHAENEALIKYFSAKHSETKKHHQMRDNLAAAVAVAEAVTTSHYYEKRLHIAHMSTKEEVNFLRRFKNSNITCEVCPHHLFLNSDFFEQEGNKGKMNPPLRSEADRETLWEAIKEGLVDIIATDHAPHTQEEKAADFEKAPCGVPGVQTMLPLLLNAVNEGLLTLQELVRLTAKRPAEIFRIKDRGQLREGYYADLVIVDLEHEEKITNDAQFSTCGWTPFHNKKVKGWPRITIINGTVAYREGVFEKENGGMLLELRD